MLQLQSLFGVVALLVIAWGLGENRRALSVEPGPAIGLLFSAGSQVADDPGISSRPLAARGVRAFRGVHATVLALIRALSKLITRNDRFAVMELPQRATNHRDGRVARI